MKIGLFSVLILSLCFINCKKQEEMNVKTDPSDSFLPMQIGNYWKSDAANYTEIQDTSRINGKLYYKFYSLVGVDASSTSYLRIDKDNQLWESWPSAPNKEYLRAKFNGNINDTFFTLNDQSVNDCEVTLLEKTNNKITFSFDMIYHPNLKGHPFIFSYIKGQGFDGNWSSLKINGVILK